MWIVVPHVAEKHLPWPPNKDGCLSFRGADGEPVILSEITEVCWRTSRGAYFLIKGRVCVPQVCVSQSDRHMRHAAPARLLRGLVSEWEGTGSRSSCCPSHPVFVITIPGLFPRGISFEGLKIQLQSDPLICVASGSCLSGNCLAKGSMKMRKGDSQPCKIQPKLLWNKNN